MEKIFWNWENWLILGKNESIKEFLNNAFLIFIIKKRGKNGTSSNTKTNCC